MQEHSGSRARLNTKAIEKRYRTFRMASTNLDNFEWDHCAIEITMREAELRNHGAKAKATFTRSRNTLLLMVEFQNLHSRLEMKDACLDMDICMEKAMELLSKCASFYIENKMLQKGNVVVHERKISMQHTRLYGRILTSRMHHVRHLKR